ncbi:MAG: EpsG family protein [Clostridia bacterium]|nr:EpsG family protein [Clostridia bacterium]
MFKLLGVFAAALVLAYFSEKNTEKALARGGRYSVWNDGAYLALVVVLVLFAGLRTSYNDTVNYIRGFEGMPNVGEWLADPENFNPFTNPLFYFYESIIKTVFNNAQMLIFISVAITQTCFLWFFKRYSQNFLFSVFVYFTLGTFVFTLAALKQVMGMAIVTLAFPYLEKKQWGRYFALVFAAMLLHTYALAFVVLPLFKAKPWRAFTFVFIAVTAVVMMNFETAITAFMEQANDLGKTLAEYEVFDNATINVFRLGVYSVPPLISLLFGKWVLKDTTDMENTLIHMSIISLAFMVMGTQAGANMFGRMGNYFELGTVCYLPTMLKKTFEPRSYRLISTVACVCFLGFFVYANAFNLTFDTAYSSVNLFDFLFTW